MAAKFTFKTDKPTGRYRSFYSPDHYIKLNNVVVGTIDSEPPHKIRLMVWKSDINEDGNPNCKWRRVRLKHESQSVDEAKAFLNASFKAITQMYNIYIDGKELEK